jgi:mannosyl-oligosaccharide alpha-1,2-mannosidase
MDYELVPVSESLEYDTARPSFINQLLRRLSLLRPAPPLSFSTRKIYPAIIAISLIVFWVFIPSRYPSLHEIHHHRIQFDFEQESSAARQVRLDRQHEVREAFLHAWKGYKDHAWLKDEVKPISGESKDPFVGWAATLVDGLDALYILGLHDEFKGALKALDSVDFSHPNAEWVPVFEVTIRYLGGLLGAYDVSEGKYPILLQKADELGEFLFRAFETPNGIPVPYYEWQKTDQELKGSNGVLVAQIGENA